MTSLRRRLTGIGVAGMAVLLVASCSPSGSHSAPSAPRSPSPSTTSTGPQYYVSIGDSYAAGYQPNGPTTGTTTRNGFAYQVIPDAAALGYHLTLVNFGCSGATTASVLHTAGCAKGSLGPGATAYGATQAVAAENFVRAHHSRIALITVVLGGNDIIGCGISASPLTCVPTALATVKTNLTRLLAGLRSAAGPSVRIVGLTYPDVLLAGTISTIPAVHSLATLSVQAFQDLINPALKATYAAVGASFVDVTAATGGYGPLSATTTLAPYGTIPVPVATICTLTFSCQYDDIHPRTAGYTLIAKLVAAQLPRR